jgi:hypothetical protein
MRQTLKFGLLLYTNLRIRSLRDQASRSDPTRSSGSDDAIPDPDPDPNHDSTGPGTGHSDPSKHSRISQTVLGMIADIN